MIPLPSSIITPRLILRPLDASHGPALAQATGESWDDLSRWMRWAINRDQLTDPAACAQYAADCHAAYEAGRDLNFCGVLKESGDFVLVARLNPKYLREGEMRFGGYWIRSCYASQGLMTEAVNALTRFSFEKAGAARVEIAHAASNDKSRAVLDRLGYKETARHKDAHSLPDGRIVDEIICMRYDDHDLPPLVMKYRYRMVAKTVPLAATANGIKTRVVTTADGDALGQLMYAAYRDTIDHDGETEADFRQEIQAIFSGREGAFDLAASFCAVTDGEIVSATLVTHHRMGPLLAYAVTHPDRRGCGLARQLLNRSLAALHAAGKPELHLAVTEGNIPAQKLYESMGFKFFDPAIPAQAGIHRQQSCK